MYTPQGLQCICHRVYSVHHRVYSVYFTGFTVWIIHFLWCCRLPVQPFSSKIMLLLVWRRAQPKVIEKIYSYLLLFRWGFLIKKTPEKCFCFKEGCRSKSFYTDMDPIFPFSYLSHPLDREFLDETFFLNLLKILELRCHKSIFLRGIVTSNTWYHYQY